jgi:uncharacterized protein DUF4154
MREAPKIASLLAVLLAASAGGQGLNEYHVKAAYVYNLARFVEWPPESFKRATEPLRLCVLGASPIRPILGEAVQGETIDGRKLEVRQLADTAQAAGCHVVFIASSENQRLPALLRELRPPGTLTVGETEDFLREGGAVNFRLENDKVRIEINLRAVAEQKLRVSPNLLSLVRVVKP